MYISAPSRYVYMIYMIQTILKMFDTFACDFCMLHSTTTQHILEGMKLHLRSLRALSDGFLFVSPLWGPPWNLNAPFWKGVGGFFFWWPEKVGGQVGKKGLKTRWPRWWLNPQLKNMLVKIKMEIFPKWRWTYKRYLKPPPSDILCFFPLSTT